MRQINFKHTAALAMFAIIAISAQAQSYYGEEYEKETGKLRGKVWMSLPEGFRQENPEKDGHASVIIFRSDSMAAFVLNPETKTYLSLPLSQLTDAGKLSGIEGIEEVSHDSKRTFKGKEVIEGVECDHYYVERTGQRKDGGTEYTNFDEWIGPDKIWRQRTDETRPGTYLVQRNIVKGAIPASKLQIPKDYKGSAIPVGGMLEMFTGKSKEQNQKDMDNVQQQLKDQQKKNEAIRNDPNKTDQQKMIELLNQMGGSTKKK